MKPPVSSIDRYRLVDRIGRGGMGEVYRAVDERLGRTVALKLLPFAKAVSGPRLERMHARLLREARAASSINHPGIVTLHDVGVWRGRLYLVMELVEGDRFTELAARGVSTREALLLVAEAADALAAAHERGILHRDIKGDNLMRTRDGRVKVVDFGLAKLGDGAHLEPMIEWSSDSPTADASLDGEDDACEAEPASLAPASFDDREPSRPGVSPARCEPPVEIAAASLTRAGDLLGTPGYIAPERLEGAPADARSEVYSLGVVLRELLAAPAPSSGGAGPRRLARAVERLVAAATASDRAERPASMAELARVVRRAAEGGPPRGLVAAAAFVTLALGAAVAFRGRASGPVDVAVAPGVQVMADVARPVPAAPAPSIAVTDDATASASAPPPTSPAPAPVVASHVSARQLATARAASAAAPPPTVASAVASVRSRPDRSAPTERRAATTLDPFGDRR